MTAPLVELALDVATLSGSAVELNFGPDGRVYSRWAGRSNGSSYGVVSEPEELEAVIEALFEERKRLAELRTRKDLAQYRGEDS